MSSPGFMVEFYAFLDRVLLDPVARAAHERAQKRPSPLRIDGHAYHHRQKRRGRS